MSDNNGDAALRNLLQNSARQVLETFFFQSVDPEPEDLDPDPVVWAEVRFQGDPPGFFHLGLSERALAESASSFLGADPAVQPSPEEAAGVLREMANVICGAALSRLESDRTFKLDPPVLLDRLPEDLPPPTSACTLGLDHGHACLRLWLNPET